MIAPTWRIDQGHVLDLLRAMPSESVQTCVTSPPYFGLRSYSTEPQVWPDGWVGELGLEPTVQLYVLHITEIFREVRRVLRRDGTCFINLGDSYVGGPAGHQDISSTTGKTAAMFAKGGRYRLSNYRKDEPKQRGTLKPKDLYMVPARVALALQDDGWWLRSEITWCKRAPMPESVTDRPTSATEKIYLFAKSERYYYDQEAVREDGAGWGYRVPKQGESGFRSERYENHNAFDNSALTATHGGAAEYLTNAGRNMWNYWLLSPEAYAEAHFATFPTEIPRRAISAGTSEKGCCGACGSPWRRVVERLASDWQARKAAGEPIRRGLNGAAASGAGSFAGISSETVDWQPSCKCAADVVPCTVLDPFTGSGTTGMVALRLGRSFVGLELQADYVAMASRRIRDDCPMFNIQESTP